MGTAVQLDKTPSRACYQIPSPAQMNHSPPPPLSPSSSTHHTSHSASGPSIPILPHSIVAAAHHLAPLDDLHLAHLINELKPPAPVWSFSHQHSNHAHHTPVITPNDRLRSDELADLPAPEAERLHAAYDIEDYLDATPDRLLVYGPSTPIIEILHQVKELLIKNNATNSTACPRRQLAPQTSLHHAVNNHIVYVARVSFQPNDGPERSYKWEKGGPDLIRFELSANQTLLPHHELPVIINWSPVELALSQALEVGHQLLALLHSHQFSEILSTLDVVNEFRPINPIVWLVDPVEYAHAQLRETTEWGWSEHHVELNSLNDRPSIIRSNSADHPNSGSSISNSTPVARDFAHSRPLSKSHLSHELYSIDEVQQQLSNSTRLISSSPPFAQIHQRSQFSKSLADDLPNWLNDLLDRRLPRLLSLHDGCLSYELLNSSHPSNSSSQHIPCNVAPKPIPFMLTSPPEKINAISPASECSPTKLVPDPRPLSVFATPTRAIILDQLSVANSVPSSDQHHILSPCAVNSLRHVQTNTLKYYPCKACSEHAFKLALSHKLNEEKRRLIIGAGANNNKSNSLSFQARNNNRRGSKNVNTIGADEHERAGDGELIIHGDFSCGSLALSTTNVGASIPVDCTSKSSLPTCTKEDNTSTANHRIRDLHHQPHQSHQSASGNNKSAGNHLDDDHLLSSSSSSTTYPVIGLGLKGKAIKEAMDREHDEFIHHQKSLSAILGFKPHHEDFNSSSKHTWDEGEVIED